MNDKKKKASAKKPSKKKASSKPSLSMTILATDIQHLRTEVREEIAGLTNNQGTLINNQSALAERVDALSHRSSGAQEAANKAISLALSAQAEGQKTAEQLAVILRGESPEVAQNTLELVSGYLEAHGGAVTRHGILKGFILDPAAWVAGLAVGTYDAVTSPFRGKSEEKSEDEKPPETVAAPA